MGRGFFCESCGAAVGTHESSCPQCGKAFDGVRCPQCGMEGPMKWFSQGCPECGYTAKASSPSSPKRIHKNPSPTKNWPRRYYWMASAFLVILSILMLNRFFRS